MPSDTGEHMPKKQITFVLVLVFVNDASKANDVVEDLFTTRS